MTLDRRPLSAARVRSRVLRSSSLWSAVEVVGETGSTNEDLLAAAHAGAAAGRVLAAEVQRQGKGRVDRSWVSPARAGLTFSMLLRPAVPPARRGWLPLLTGVAVARVLRSDYAIEATLKWPNDVLVDDAKIAGILAEQTSDADGGWPAVVVGVGINVSTEQAELPSDAATSMALRGVAVADREPLLSAVLLEFERWYLPWTASSPGAGPAGDAVGSGLLAAYRGMSATIGREVRVDLPGGRAVAGLASQVDDVGRLVVTVSNAKVAVSAGDVIHVR